MSNVRVGDYVEMADGSVARVVSLDGRMRYRDAQLKPLLVGDGSWAWWGRDVFPCHTICCSLSAYVLSGEAKVIPAGRGQQIELEARLAGGCIHVSSSKHSM